MTPMKLSIVFVNFNSTGPLVTAIESVRDHPPSHPYEIIVVDNASRVDPTDELLGRFPGIRVLRNPWNVGLGRALNRGIELSRGEYVVAANPDVVVLEGTLDALISFMDRTKDAGAVVPQTYYPDMTFQSNVRRFHRLRFLLFGRKSLFTRLFPGNPLSKDYLGLELRNASEPVPVEVGVGNFLVLRRSALEEVGTFDPGIFLFSEDTDLCYRLHLGGWKTYLHPGASLIHAHGLSRKHASQRSHHHRRKGVVLFLCKHRRVPRLLCPLLWLGLALADAAASLSALIGFSAREAGWTGTRP